MGIEKEIEMNREKENELLLIACRWEAINNILNGKEPSNFMILFPEVRKVFDLYHLAKQNDLIFY